MIVTCFFLFAETMVVQLTGGETIEFNLAEITEITFGPDVSADDMVKIIKQIPIKFIKNSPNPFNPVTTISFEIGVAGKTSVEIFNVKGQKVNTLINEDLPAGEHSVNWIGTDSNNNKVSSGVYFYKVSVNNQQKISKMIMLK